MHRADDDADDRAEHRAHDALARAQRVGAQHRERPEHDPERVLRPYDVGDEHGARQRGRAPEAVVQPGRVTVEVRGRALARDGEQVGDARRLAPEELIEPAASLGRHRGLGVGGDLRDGVADLLGAEARVQRGRGRGVAVAHRVRLERGERVPERRDGVVQVVPRSLRSVQQPRAAVEHRRGGVLDRPGGGHAGAGVDRLRDAVQPLQLVDHPEDRPVRRSEAGGPERRREERAAHALDGAVRAFGTAPAQAVRQPPARADDRVPEGVHGRRGPQERHREERAGRRDAPPEERLDRRGHVAQGHGQDEGEQERRRRPREHGADDRREQDARTPRSPSRPPTARRSPPPAIRRRRAPRRRRRARPAPGAAGASSRRSRPAAASRTSRRRRRPPRPGRRRPPCRSRRPRAWRSPCARHGAAPRGRGRAAAASSSGCRVRPPMARSSPPGRRAA